jgi:hypothetical protein
MAPTRRRRRRTVATIAVCSPQQALQALGARCRGSNAKLDQAYQGLDTEAFTTRALRTARADVTSEITVLRREQAALEIQLDPAERRQWAAQLGFGVALRWLRAANSAGRQMKWTMQTKQSILLPDECSVWGTRNKVVARCIGVRGLAEKTRVTGLDSHALGHVSV